MGLVLLIYVPNLLYLLIQQQQLIKPQGFERHYPTNSILEDEHGKANNEDDDASSG